MKTIILSLLFIALCSDLIGQVKGDNTIFIPRRIWMHKLKEILYHNNYQFESNCDSNYLFTQPKFIDQSLFGVSVKLSFFNSNEGLYIKGASKITGDDSDRAAEFNSIEYFPLFGKKGFDWAEMERVAKLLTPDLTYLNESDEIKRK